MSVYAALASLMQLLDDIILHNQYPTSLLGNKALIKSLHEKFGLLQESLQDYSFRGDEAADGVEGRIRDVAYGVQDVIETQIAHQISSERQTHVAQMISRRAKTSTKQKVFAELISDFKSVFCRKGRSVAVECFGDLPMLEPEIVSIVEEIKAIKESQKSEDSLLDYDSIDVGGHEQAAPSKDDMVGFGEDLITIKEQLCGLSTHLQIIPIVGMGGIGKTTLARNAFHDSLISYHFYCRSWTTVSQGYGLKRVLQTVLNSLTGVKDRRLEDEGTLKERIYKSLKGQRYLIVLDDVWSIKFWDDIKSIFPNDFNGSRILITTRLLDVAHFVAGSSGFIHEMQFLNVDASWNLLREKVFAQECCAPELENIGRYIASKCGGLPLAIVVIAGMVSNVGTRTPHYWKRVAKNVGSILHRDAPKLSNILSLSFNHLSHQLKACFLYMGCLPEDAQVSVTRLALLWNAEGFLRSIDRSKTFEQVADECVGDLIRRNLVVVTKRGVDGQFKYCTIHDLLRDFCRERSLQECFFHGIDWERHLNIPKAKSVRRIIPYSYPQDPWTLGTMFKKLWTFGTLSKQPCSFGTCKFVRSILLFDRTDVTENRDAYEWGNFKLVRVLDIAYVHRCLAPFAVSSMFLLKYLTVDIVSAGNELAPIFKLPYLESLILYGSIYCCILLPSEFWKAPRLRNLKGFLEMELPPAHLVAGADLDYLQLRTLETVREFTFTNEAIEMIRNLRKLKVKYIKFEDNDKWKQYCLSNLVHLHQLEEVKMMFSHIKRPFESTSVAFPSNLKKLSLSGCRLSWRELTVVGSIPSLQVLKLRDKAVVGDEWEPVQGEFLHLKFLLLEGLNLESWNADTTHFPCLQHLKIIKCYFLLEIPSEIGDIPTLKFITVQDSSRAGVSAIQILEEQRNSGNDELQVLVPNLQVLAPNISSSVASGMRHPDPEGSPYMMHRRLLRIDEWDYDKAMPRGEVLTQKK